VRCSSQCKVHDGLVPSTKSTQQAFLRNGLGEATAHESAISSYLVCWSEQSNAGRQPIRLEAVRNCNRR